MAHFELARFTEGRVITTGWWAPASGEAVRLARGTGDVLMIVGGEDDYELPVAYRWPKGTNLQASRKALAHLERLA